MTYGCEKQYSRRGTPWYLACSLQATAKHREHKVVRRNREQHEVFGKTLIALDSGSHCARYANGSSRCVGTRYSPTPTQFSTSSWFSDSAGRSAMHTAGPK